MPTAEEKAIVRKRAGYRCEYCKAPEEITGYAFHIEHVHPRAEGGKDDVENYALCCMPCNRSKWYHTTGQDPKTGRDEDLFNPRNEKWSDHFHLDKKIQIAGKTPIGRATERPLQMNQSRQLEARRLWREAGLYP